MGKQDAAVSVLAVILVATAIAAGAAVVSAAFMWSWNGFVAQAMGADTIDLGTAFAGIIFLAIVGSFFKAIPHVSRS